MKKSFLGTTIAAITVAIAMTMAAPTILSLIMILCGVTGLVTLLNMAVTAAIKVASKCSLSGFMKMFSWLNPFTIIGKLISKMNPFSRANMEKVFKVKEVDEDGNPIKNVFERASDAWTEQLHKEQSENISAEVINDDVEEPSIRSDSSEVNIPKENIFQQLSDKLTERLQKGQEPEIAADVETEIPITDQPTAQHV